MPERPDPEAGEVWFDQRKGQAGRVLAVRPGAEQVTLVRPGGHPWFAAFAQLRRPTAHEERQLAALARLHRQAVRDR
ncbi:hypothetical protein NX801_09345 [Streptomyces sp. LP05-1]|uniref:Uncharacterized protein n=1 Tax=Streptomyces pyxinae TaxID=2970734 RepID=A0ABT2CFK6_9ACTN|nr:hypothetical protein [Streptomyces sp. LP05-1]MCS0635867.1 hypothetical protein [Streptomyces sp. LP05-1]